jgi:hypothetical protein
MSEVEVCSVGQRLRRFLIWIRPLGSTMDEHRSDTIGLNGTLRAKASLRRLARCRGDFRFRAVKTLRNLFVR